MGMTPLLAEFSDPQREAEFRAREENEQLPDLRTAMGISAVMLLVVYVLDVVLFAKVNPEFVWSLAGARGLQLLGLACAGWVPWRGKIRGAMAWAVCLGAALVSLGHQWASYLITIATGRPVQSVWAAIFALVSLTGVILPMRFAVSAALSFVVPTMVVCGVILPLPTRDLMHVCISLVLVTGLGTVLNHRLNRWRRLEFAARELERQTNVMLTKEVEEKERTTGDLKAQASALEARLATAQRLEAMGRLAGGVAHDLNNLLTPIMGYTELAIHKSTGAPEVMEMLREVKSATSNARDLVAHLLAVGCRQRLCPTTFELGTFLREQEPHLLALLRHDVKLRIEDGVSISVAADRTQMMQVLVNLVVNARDALPKGGEIVIRLAKDEADATRAIELGVEQAGSFALISVEDNGTGMDEETRSRLFEPFFTTKPKGMGTGLGLATVYGIVRQHKGAIQVESELGRGTIFTLWLPATAAVASLSPTALAPANDQGGDETVLVVDDDEVVRQLLVRLLGGVGYRVLSAGSGLAALETAQTHQGPVHLAICDVVMPEMRGPEVWERLRELRPECRVLFISGFSNEAMSPRQTHKVLAKPFSRADLLKQVRSVLDDNPVRDGARLKEAGR